jgi:hypothetical protein
MTTRDGGEQGVLSAAELARLRSAERWMVRYFVMGVLAAAIGVGLGLAGGDLAGWRLGAMLVGVLFLGAAIAMQLRLKCPRCGARLGLQGRAVLPDACSNCAIAIPRPQRMTSELDN